MLDAGGFSRNRGLKILLYIFLFLSCAWNRALGRATKASLDPIASEEVHNTNTGRSLLGERFQIFLRYSACNGLTNQFYCHVSAVTIAKWLGATLVLPLAVKRSSFGDIYSLNPSMNNMSWTGTPMKSLFDMDSFIHHWTARGLPILQTPKAATIPDMKVPDEAFQEYRLPDVEDYINLRIRGIFTANLEVLEVVSKVRSIILQEGAKLQGIEKRKPLLIDLPCSLFVVRTRQIMPFVTEVARSLKFSPRIRSIANQVVHSIRGMGLSTLFNGLHLRMERDAMEWAIIMGGQQQMWQIYKNAMQAMPAFNSTNVLFIASGLNTYSGQNGQDSFRNDIIASGLASHVLYKELFMEEALLAELESEQKALVDFLVLAQSEQFVGIKASTFSYYIMEYRALYGKPRTSSNLMSTPMTTDPLLEAAAHIKAF